jgi:hypothetical protein
MAEPFGGSSFKCKELLPSEEPAATFLRDRSRDAVAHAGTSYGDGGHAAVRCGHIPVSAGSDASANTFNLNA